MLQVQESSVSIKVEHLPLSSAAIRDLRAPETELVEALAGSRGWVGRWRQLPSWLRRLAGPALLLLVWHVITEYGLVDPRELSSPAATLEAGWELLSTGELQTHLLASLVRAGSGLVLGVAIGLILSILSGLLSEGEDLIDSSMNILRMIPTIALAPLIVAWIGVGEIAKISMIVIGTAFPIYMNTFSAIRGVDQKLIESARAFGLSRYELVRRVILPGALPGFFVGLRWAFGSSWLLLFFSEQLNANSGIGWLINQAQTWNRTDIIVLGLVVYGVFGLLGDTFVRVLEGTLLSWRRGFQGT